MNWSVVVITLVVFGGFALALLFGYRTRLPPLDLDWRDREARVSAIRWPRYRRPISIGLGFLIALAARVSMNIRHGIKVNRAFNGGTLGPVPWDGRR